MKTFTNKDIADYYNQTLNHYQRWWHLDQSLAVHYGFWEKDTRSFREALENTNRYLMEKAGVLPNERILDAGCGVGGSCFYLARQKKARVTGITLSEKQLQYAERKARSFQPGNLVDFKLEDFNNTSFKAETFDLVWAVESISSAPDKPAFAREAFRILKPSGRIIITDYFKSEENIPDQAGLMEKWRLNWSMAPILPLSKYLKVFQNAGFVPLIENDVTDLIFKTSRKMYVSSCIGALPSTVYNLFNHTSRFAKDHYKSGLYQYKALKKGLWNYRVLLLKKAE